MGKHLLKLTFMRSKIALLLAGAVVGKAFSDAVDLIYKMDVSMVMRHMSTFVAFISDIDNLGSIVSLLIFLFSIALTLSDKINQGISLIDLGAVFVHNIVSVTIAMIGSSLIIFLVLGQYRIINSIVDNNRIWIAYVVYMLVTEFLAISLRKKNMYISALTKGG